MFISNLRSLERGGNNSLTSKSRLKNPKIHELRYVVEFKTHTRCVRVPLFLVDLDKKYRNEIELYKI